jgi:hypothetical protein
MSHYATSLTPSFSVQTFSRVRFILSLPTYDSPPLLCLRVTHFLSY